MKESGIITIDGCTLGVWKDERGVYYVPQTRVNALFAANGIASLSTVLDMYIHPAYIGRFQETVNLIKLGSLVNLLFIWSIGGYPHLDDTHTQAKRALDNLRYKGTVSESLASCPELELIKTGLIA